MEPTSVNSVKDKVDRTVRLSKWKMPLIEAMLEELKLVKAVALSTMKSPPICWGPSRLMTPAADEGRRMLPAKVVQDAMAETSACATMVAVG